MKPGDELHPEYTCSEEMPEHFKAELWAKRVESELYTRLKDLQTRLENGERVVGFAIAVAVAKENEVRILHSGSGHARTLQILSRTIVDQIAKLDRESAAKKPMRAAAFEFPPRSKDPHDLN